jgi:hypothetical protein
MTIMKAGQPLGLLFAALTFVTLPATAQIRASELSAVSQTIDGTKISLEYSRPRARGRAPLFGGVVRWGEVWTPGANYATTLEVNKEIRLEGHPVAKGKYSMWFAVRKDGNWTLVLDPDFHRFHMEPPDSNAKQIRLPVHPVTAPFEEVLRWQFDGLEVSGATLVMHWGPTAVPMKLDVTPSLRMQTPAVEGAPFVGRYDWTWTGPDSTKKIQLVVTQKNGYLMGDLVPKDEYFVDFALIRVADDWYTIGLFEKGAIYEVVRDLVIEFSRGPDGVWTFEMRDDDDKLQARGRKRP